MLQALTFNTSARARTRVLHGREYFVAPATMIVEGVHKGNKGRILYRRPFLKRYAFGWNHKPIVNYHPKEEGEYISASDADVLDKFGMGFLLNTRYGKTADDKPGWLTEAWFDKQQTRRVDPRVYNALRNGETTEVSTGMKLRVGEGGGLWNGEGYDSEAVACDADHLAILPDQEGACSVRKGAGLFVNRDFAGAQRKKLARSGSALPDGSFPIVTVQDLKNAIQEAIGRAKDKRRSRRHIVKRARALGRTDLLPSGWVRNSAVSNSDKGEEEMPVTKRGKKKEKFDANAHIKELVANRFTEEDREWLEELDEDVLKSIPVEVANEEGQDDDDDADDDDDDEEQVVNAGKKDKKKGAKKANKAEKPVKKAAKRDAVYNVEPDEEGDADDEEPIVNEERKDKKVTLAGLIANATPKERKLLLKSMGINPEQLREMKLSHQRERAQLVQKIVANEANQFEEEELNEMGMDTLRKMAASMTPGRRLKDAEFGVEGDDEFGDVWEGIPSFMGANAAEPSGKEGTGEDRFLLPPGESTPTVNSGDDEDEEDEKSRKKKRKKVAA